MYSCVHHLAPTINKHEGSESQEAVATGRAAKAVLNVFMRPELAHRVLCPAEPHAWCHLVSNSIPAMCIALQ